MQPEAIAKIIEVNRQFYQQFAAAFDETRQRLQPGVAGLLEDLVPRQRILDLGCGNGALFAKLTEEGFEGSYTGLDFSEELVEIARSRTSAKADGKFFVRDLADPGWNRGLEGSFDRVLAFAVFHHLPPELVRSTLHALRPLLEPDGLLVHSNWQFLNSPRWRARIQPWEIAGIDPQAVGADDYLLDWRRGGSGLRYVHFYSEEELARLAAQTGFEIVETFFSDGKEGNLALYQVWQ